MGVVVRLPESLRGSLKDPMGSLFTDASELLAQVDGMLVTVGDVVTFACEQAGRVPDVAVIDERTERSPVRSEIKTALAGADVVVENPAGGLSEEVLRALNEALLSDESVRIRVDGEEDLVVLPAIIGAPEGASVVYGQPGEGMVLVRVTPAVKKRVRELISAMDGDPDAVFSILGT